MPFASSLPDALAAGPLLLDGGLSTAVEESGHDISGRLWSARLLHDAPEAIVAVHRGFAAAGARVLTSASYQATFEGFASVGVDDAATARLLRTSVTLARWAADEQTAHDGLPRWVAASVGPFGALAADGSEYTGEYGDAGDVARLRTFHRRRLEVLAEANPDVLACETVPCLAEAEALIAEIDRLGVPAWLSLTTVTGPDGVARTRRGEPAAEAFAMAGDVPSVIAVGVNCTSPIDVLAGVRAAASADRPVVVYPNSGETWHAPSRSWIGDPHLAADDVTAWLRAGARLVGGCCRVGPDGIAALAPVVERGLIP